MDERLHKRAEDGRRLHKKTKNWQNMAEDRIRRQKKDIRKKREGRRT